MALSGNRLPLINLLRQEFSGYNREGLQRDVLAGITVGAVGLPLALAFGVASGADAAAGLITAILAGLLIGGLGGASYQISGPTGAMSAVLIVLAQRYGLAGVWVASVLAGVFLVLLGVFKLGRYITFIPSPVITGFTSGIALIIAIGQLDNVLGVATPKAENAVAKLFQYFAHPVLPDWRALALAVVVMVTMIVAPRLTKAIPGSLIGIVLATLVAVLSRWDVTVIGDIPRTILLENRLSWTDLSWAQFSALLTPAVSIAALGAIESLLCGSVGSTMSGRPFDSNQELIAQGVGNIVIPFFGGVPATAAIARSSVAIKSGAVTRVTSFVHAGVLLLSALVLAPLIGRIPLAALGGVLLVTAWRMNEWESIHFFTRTRLKHALLTMIITIIATAALDLTQAIVIGLVLSAAIYLRQSATSTMVTSDTINAEKLELRGTPIAATCPNIHVYYLTGPVFFGSVTTVLEAFETAEDYHTIIISMRGVPLIDVMGAQALRQIVEEHQQRGGEVYITALQPAVQEMFKRTELSAVVGEQNMHWSSADVIVALHEQRLIHGCPRCDAHGDTCALVSAARMRAQAHETAPGIPST